MPWNEWLASFEGLEQQHYRYRLEGDGRHGTLRDLFQDGYSPERAFQLVRLGARMDKIGPLLIPAVFIACLGLGFMAKGLFFDGPWEGGAIISALSGAFVVWGQYTAHQVAQLASTSRPTTLRRIK